MLLLFLIWYAFVVYYNVLQGGCGVIVEWCICQCATFMGRGLSALVLELRKELFKDPYSKIDWDKARSLCAKVC